MSIILNIHISIHSATTDNSLIINFSKSNAQKLNIHTFIKAERGGLFIIPLIFLLIIIELQ